jgi:DNA-binding response OmpR family regulator
MKVVIADRIPDLMESIGLIISKNKPDWQLSFVGLSQNGLKILGSIDYPDVIILGMDQVDICELDFIKQIRDDSDLPIVVLSYNSSISTMIQVFDYGADDYIVKPFNEKVFIARLESLIRRRK